jgi:hypothetical protein
MGCCRAGGQGSIRSGAGRCVAHCLGYPAHSCARGKRSH